MKNKTYLVWSAISALAVIITLIDLVPAFTIGFADANTRVSYYIELAALFVFTFVSLFLTIHNKSKIAPGSEARVEQTRKKITKYIIITALIVILLLAGFSALTSFR